MSILIGLRKIIKMIVKTIKTRVFKEKENIIDFIKIYVQKIPDKSVLVITSKIIALAEGRVVHANDEKTKTRLVKKESEFAIKTKYCWLTIKDGLVMATAGIDESNASGSLILLPKDSFKSAKNIRREIMKNYGLKKLGVLITDSRTAPLRAGVIGAAIGYAGFKGIRNYVGKPDIFGRKFKFAKTNIADSLAASAVLCMGEGRERFPLALIEDAPIEFSDRIYRNETKISLKDDMYRPLFNRRRK